MTKRIWGRHPGLPGDAGRWGVVGYKTLNSAFYYDDNLERIAQRYRDRFPEQEFVVAEEPPKESV